MGKVSGVIKAMGFSMGQDQKRQILAIDEEFENLQAEVTKLKSELLRLQAQVNPLERERDQLRAQLQRNDTTPSLARLAEQVQLDESELKVIKRIANEPSSTERTVNSIADDFSTSGVRIRVLLRRLEEKQLVREVESWEGYTFYQLTNVGQEYVVSKNLVG